MAVFGLLADDKRPLPKSVREMATTYITRIKILQPQSPYLIAGECVGGVIAYEIAQQLHSNGDRVILLLLDSWCPSSQRYRQYLRYKLPLYWRQRWTELQAAQQDFFTALIQQIRDRPSVNWLDMCHYFQDVIKAQHRIIIAWYQQIRSICRHEALGDNYIRQAMRYHPANCHFPVNLIMSEQNNQLGLVHAWQQLAHKSLQTWVIAGTHETYLRDTPKACAQAVNACLEQLFNDTGGHHESS
jgi:thioesterase domain-containing protein